MMKPRRGYYIIDPGLSQPDLQLSKDTQVRCLSYMIRIASKLLPIPDAVELEVIPAEYLGGPYAAIGMYTDKPNSVRVSMPDLASSLENRLEVLLKETGIPQLISLSISETNTWSNVLKLSAQRIEEGI